MNPYMHLMEIIIFLLYHVIRMEIPLVITIKDHLTDRKTLIFKVYFSVQNHSNLPYIFSLKNIRQKDQLWFVIFFLKTLIFKLLYFLKNVPNFVQLSSWFQEVWKWNDILKNWLFPLDAYVVTYPTRAKKILNCICIRERP